MTQTIAFSLVDVFAISPLTGNPVAIVPDADRLPLETMQALAREFNQSETTFLLRPDSDEAAWQLRSFTPIGAEVFGAGHNALGAWLWLAAAGRLGEQPVGRYVQQIGADLLPVTIGSDGAGALTVAMDQSAPQFGSEVADRERLAASLALALDDLVPELAPRVVSTEAGHLQVAIRDRAAVDRAVPDTAALAAVLRDVGGEGCYVYALDPVDAGSVAYARFFNPTMGIWEDPATGTAAGPLGALLVAEGRAAPGEIVIEQGFAVGRPSRIRVTVDGERVQVSGGGLVVADGRLYL
jgi:trans-2,3-dihydro-3-hydroxyanthranilate isomerase